MPKNVEASMNSKHISISKHGVSIINVNNFSILATVTISFLQLFTKKKTWTNENSFIDKSQEEQQKKTIMWERYTVICYETQNIIAPKKYVNSKICKTGNVVDFFMLESIILFL